MTTASTLCTRQSDRGLEAAGGATVGDLNPLVEPAPTHRVVDAPLRSRVVLHGLVLDQRTVDWAGGRVLEVTFSDGTGGVCLAFFGRRGIAGIEPGRALTVAGTVGSRHGRAVLMNPLYWLHEPAPEVADA
ncbi:MAG: hypothetical protein ACRDYW_03670 [Acidimicrobiales bacterium]